MNESTSHILCFNDVFVCYVYAHLSKHLYCLDEKTSFNFFGHWQEMSSTVKDAQQSQSVALSEG